MADSFIDLTPKGILGYLKRIESKIQREEFKVYSPLSVCTSGNITDNQLKYEACQMLEFIGLKGYETDVKFVAMEKGVAGYITSLNNTYERSVHINVSDRYISNWNTCLAILAHEICHKLLYVNGLYEKDEKKNETLVDLSTLYIGFGQLVLNGYISDSGNQIIGYLTFDNYKIANQIMCVVYGKMSSRKTGLKDVDFLIDIALEKWENAENEYELLKDCFIHQEKQMSEYYRNLTLLEQIIKQCKQNMMCDYERYDNIFFKTLREQDGKFKNKLTALSILYDLIAKDVYPITKENPFVARVNTIVNNTIYDLFQAYQLNCPIELKNIIECPHCGNTTKNVDRIINRMLTEVQWIWLQKAVEEGSFDERTSSK